MRQPRRAEGCMQVWKLAVMRGTVRVLTEGSTVVLLRVVLTLSTLLSDWYYCVYTADE